MPSTSNTDWNGQTVEGGLSLWDGRTTRSKYEVMFQWIVNPYWQFSELFRWTGTTDRGWQRVGFIPVDANWHQLRIMADFQNGTASMMIDGNPFESGIGVSPGPQEWGTEIAATIQAEIISIDPGGYDKGAMHKAEVKNWNWIWETASASTVFLPSVAKG